MSKLSTFVNLQSIQTLEDMLRTDWMECTEITAMGNRRPYFIPDCEGFGISTEHYKVRIVKASAAIDHRLNLRRVEELSDFPDSKVILTGWKGELYVRIKPDKVNYHLPDDVEQKVSYNS